VIQIPNSTGGFEYRDAVTQESDRLHDLAVLRVSGAAEQPLALAPSGTLREGTAVAFVGFPIGGALGFSPVMHRGIVSSLVSSVAPPPTSRGLSAAAVRQAREGAFELIQLDATAYPGNSGGPLIEVTTGQVAGVISMVLVKGARESALTQPSGISYAVPVRYLAPLVSGR
jgi:S1-C subfamily serine protease